MVVVKLPACPAAWFGLVLPGLRLFPLLLELLLLELFELPKPLPLAFDGGFVPVLPRPEEPLAGPPAPVPPVLFGGALPELPPRPLLPVLPPAPEFPPAPCEAVLEPPPDELPPRPELVPLLDGGVLPDRPALAPLDVGVLDGPPRELPPCVPMLPGGPPVVVFPAVPPLMLLPPDPPGPATAPLVPPPDAGPFWRYSTMKFAHSWEKTLDSCECNCSKSSWFKLMRGWPLELTFFSMLNSVR